MTILRQFGASHGMFKSTRGAACKLFIIYQEMAGDIPRLTRHQSLSCAGPERKRTIRERSCEQVIVIIPLDTPSGPPWRQGCRRQSRSKSAFKLTSDPCRSKNVRAVIFRIDEISGISPFESVKRAVTFESAACMLDLQERVVHNCPMRVLPLRSQMYGRVRRHLKQSLTYSSDQRSAPPKRYGQNNVTPQRHRI